MGSDEFKKFMQAKLILRKSHFNLFVPNPPFLYPLEKGSRVLRKGRERVHWEQMS